MEASMKERNYRTVNTLRQQNQREQRRLDERLNSKMGLRANCLSEVKAVSREQQRIRQELVKVKKTVTTTWGILPPREGPGVGAAGGAANPVRDTRMVQLEDLMKHTPKASVHGNQKAARQDKDKDKPRVADSGKVEGGESEKPEPPRCPEATNPSVPGESPDHGQSELTPRSKTKPVELSLAEVSVSDAKDNVTKRLVAPDLGGSSNSSPKHEKNTKTLLAPPSGTSNQPRVLTPIDEQAQEETTVLESQVDNGPRNSQKPKGGDPKQKKMVRRDSEKKMTRRDSDIQPTFDQDKYTHDGTLRTVHQMPDFDTRIAEATKARYIRHKGKVLSEQELSVNEMFAQENKTEHLKGNR